MKQTCEQCRWFHFKADRDFLRGNPPACYYNGKWTKWLPKKSVDKPNNCEKFSI